MTGERKTGADLELVVLLLVVVLVVVETFEKISREVGKCSRRRRRRRPNVGVEGGVVWRIQSSSGSSSSSFLKK